MKVTGNVEVESTVADGDKAATKHKLDTSEPAEGEVVVKAKKVEDVKAAAELGEGDADKAEVTESKETEEKKEENGTEKEEDKKEEENGTTEKAEAEETSDKKESEETSEAAAEEKKEETKSE